MKAPLNSRSRRLIWLRSVLEKRSGSGVGIVAIVLLGFLGFTQIFPNGLLVYPILLIIGYEFQKRLDQGVPLLQLTSLIAVLQWLVGPLLSYAYGNMGDRYTMYVPEPEYFQFAIPGTAFFVAVMLSTGASVKQTNPLQMVDRRNFFAIGFFLNVVATVATLVAPRVGGGLQFALFLTSQLRYVGAIYFMFSRSKLRLLFAAGSCVQLVSNSVAEGMFHDLILWVALLFCYWFAQRKWTLSVKLSLLLVAAISLFSIQVVKQEYRLLKARGENPSLVGMIISYMTPGGKAWDTSVISLAITRLNQGWIISAIMKNVPENVPFAEGETIQEAFFVSAVPRFLFPDKATAGGLKNFRKYTGLVIDDGTTFGLSPLGEAYLNYGVVGGIGFMLVFGGCFAIFYYGTLRFALKQPTFLFWIPLIFYQAMKAETELLVILNQLIKGSMVAFGGYYAVRQILPVKLKKDRKIPMSVVPPVPLGAQGLLGSGTIERAN